MPRLFPSARRHLAGPATLASSFALVAFLACDPPTGAAPSEDAGQPSLAPDGGLLDFDAADIPVPWDDAGRNTSTTPDAASSPDVSVAPPPTEAGPPPTEAGPTAPVCTGLPSFCSGEPAITCSSIQGCTPTGTCTGISEDCYSQFGDFSCISLEGCVWNTSTNSCSGLSWSCDLFSGQTSCGSQLGCTWSSSCDGTPTPCDLFPAATCTTQPGCFLQL